MSVILFQGDSVTDCGRSRDNDFHYGQGYPFMVAGSLGYDNPGEYKFYNRGVGGNRIVDVYSRIKADIINLKPDVMSLLIGVNDVWHEINWKNGVSTEKYEMIYDLIVKEVREVLPNLQIMVLEPFVVHGSTTDAKWEAFDGEVRARAAAAKRIAEKHNLKFVPLQSKFDEMYARYPHPYWTDEGVHPTCFGHELIAREWLRAYAEMTK